MELISKVFKEPEKVWPVGSGNLQFRRVTTRYGKPKGSFSSNQGFLRVMRDAATGRFVSISS